MVELFMHRWGLVSHSFGSHLFLACHILRGFEARLLCLMDVDVGQRMRKVPQQYPEFFGQSPSNCQKQYFLLTFTLFLGWKIEPSSFWQSYSFPRINDPIVIEGWDCSIFFHIWYLVSSIMLAFCSLYMFLYFPFWLINNATLSLSHTSKVWLITTILVSYTSSWSVNIDWLPPVWYAILYSFLVDSNRSTQQSKLENHPTLALLRSLKIITWSLFHWWNDGLPNFSFACRWWSRLFPFKLGLS